MMIVSSPRIGRSRALHLIDAENLCGSSLVSVAAATKLRDDYMFMVPVGPLDQIVLASSHVSILALGMAWGQGKRYLMRSGPNGADICLAGIVAEEKIESVFDHVYMGPGDGGLAPFAAHLGSRDVSVTSVSLIRSLSPHMRMATSQHIFLDRPGIAVLRAA
jgi:hypothetical protein